jgi:hypothetical protein
MSGADQVQEFFTWATVLTLSGSVSVTVIVTNTLGALSGRFGTDMVRRWIAFLVAVLCAYGAAVYATTGHRRLHGYEWVLAFINACLIWTSAFGVNETIVQGQSDPHGKPLRAQNADEKEATRTSFFRSWL